MKKEQLYEVISDIDDEYVTDAEKVSKSKNKLVIRILASVACLALAVAVSVPFVFRSKMIDEKEVTEPEDIFVLPKDEIRKNVKKDKIVYWEDWTSSEYLVYYGDGSRTVRADIGKELDRLTSYGDRIESNELREGLEIARKMPVFTEYNQKMNDSEWQELICKFENIVGVSFYDFVGKAPDKWRYPEFYTFDHWENGETLGYVFEYKIDNSALHWLNYPEIELHIGTGEKIEYDVCDYLSKLYVGAEEKTVINGISMTIFNSDWHYWVTFEMNGKPYEIESRNINRQYLEEFLCSITAESAKKDIIELPVRFPMDYEYKSDDMLREMYYLDHGIKYHDFSDSSSSIWDGNREIEILFGVPPLYIAYGSGSKYITINKIYEFEISDRYELIESEKINSISVDFYSWKRYLNNTDFVYEYLAVYEYDDNLYRVSGYDNLSIDEIKDFLLLVLA
ncbi:MAG: hypothetical protein IKU43_05620 [Clostridia bacterium]|nr:hypothetical protein [Clostridia bacterium]